MDNTPQNLRQWMKAPDTFKRGALMPAMRLNDEQLDQVTACDVNGIFRLIMLLNAMVTP